MRYVRIVAGPNGESHFDEVEVSLPPVAFVPGRPPVGLAAGVPVTTLNFATIPAGWEGEYHPTPRRQFWITLAGEVAVTVSDGERRHFSAGAVVLLEDLTGKGHHSQVVGAEAYFGLLVVVAPDT